LCAQVYNLVEGVWEHHLPMETHRVPVCNRDPSCEVRGGILLWFRQGFKSLEFGAFLIFIFYISMYTHICMCTR
jgi:hypothetical protein